jgi:hypothetical protein
VRTLLIAATFALFVVDFGIAATLSMKAPRSYYRYEVYSCLGNVAVLGAWLLFGDLTTWVAVLVALYAFIQAAGVTVAANKLRIARGKAGA